ncbi:hypothetical protein LUX12_13840 [Streptomyces somaliensis]|uniref:Uncharacterized protein n=1 Tax=Streptomyces somaliensis (strain ATCC 33201 / DSM 40738 / JCM 12659 / KCTC 9044 / NCTC 11332 / NRRL B-12077 / IP 733) TaxID=1134445 RepID=A0AA44IF62_STRE0|nr:hypothetical protein [Streptomyces somaliensis]MCP9945636.1 hypothetical protein [Streptomyces somaliensis]MCP9961186.1 hypothetical protein [Streptomyces somaliensis]MCP9973982.1 hypothetical protein [Streptomyces somaliensis]MCQ0024869.1 hypothetical protein [Streptomyces somaliensis DSM 40738]NKY16043.1 hypothetical protein [Streptomyces somaliensis DSM 40738]
MAIFLFFVLLAVVLGLVGVAVEGLTYLLVVGAVVLVADLVFLGAHLSRRTRRRAAR